MREIEIVLMALNWKATAMLMEHENPRLCEAFWKFLEKPWEHRFGGLSFGGRGLGAYPLEFPEDMWKEENATPFVGPGELMLRCHPAPQSWQMQVPTLIGNPLWSGKNDEMLIYWGRGMPRFYYGTYADFAPCSVLARIRNADLAKFAENVMKTVFKERSVMITLQRKT